MPTSIATLLLRPAFCNKAGYFFTKNKGTLSFLCNKAHNATSLQTVFRFCRDQGLKNVSSNLTPRGRWPASIRWLQLCLHATVCMGDCVCECRVGFTRSQLFSTEFSYVHALYPSHPGPSIRISVRQYGPGFPTSVRSGLFGTHRCRRSQPHVSPLVF